MAALFALAPSALAQVPLTWSSRDQVLDPKVLEAWTLPDVDRAPTLVSTPWELPDPDGGAGWNALLVGLGWTQLARIVEQETDATGPLQLVDDQPVQLGPVTEVFSGPTVRASLSGETNVLWGERTLAIRWTSLVTEGGGRATAEMMVGPEVGLRPQYLHLSLTARQEIGFGIVEADPLKGLSAESIGSVQASTLADPLGDLLDDVGEVQADGPPPAGCAAPAAATWCDQAGATDAGCTANAGAGGTTPCATRQATSWIFNEDAFCRSCPYTFYVLVECGREMHLPLADMEGVDLTITNVITGQPVSLRCLNDTAKAQAAGDVPAAVLTGDCCGDAALEEWWGPAFDETDTDGMGHVTWGFPDCTTISNNCADLPCGGEIAGVTPGDRQTMDCFIQDDSGLCGLYRVDITSGGYVWELYANCDGAATEEFPIYFDCTEAWAAFNPLAELAVSDLVVAGDCPDSQATFLIENIGCADHDGDVTVRVQTGCTPADQVDVLIPGPLPANSSMPVAVDISTSCGATTLEVIVDPDDAVMECTEDAGAAACSTLAGADSIIDSTCDCNAALTAVASAPTRACAGETITLDGSASTLTPCAVPLYRWSLGGAPLTGWDTIPTLDVPFTGCPSDVTYGLEVRCMGEACSDQTTVSVTCHQPQAAAGTDVFACLGSDVVLSGSGSSLSDCGSAEYRWSAPDGSVLADWSSSADVTLSSLASDDTGSYLLELRCADGIGCTVSDTVQVTTVSLTAPADDVVAVAVGEAITLSADGLVSSGCSGTECRFVNPAGHVIRDWNPSHELTIAMSALSHAGSHGVDFRCVDAPSCIVSMSLDLEVVTFTPDAGLDEITCTGSAVILSAAGTTFEDCKSPEYRWSAPDGSTLGDWGTGTDVTLSDLAVDDAGDYLLETRCPDTPGSTWSDTVQVTVTSVELGAQATVSATAGGSTTLTASAVSSSACSETEVRFLNPDGSLARDWSSDTSWTTPGLAQAHAGDYTIELRCVDTPSCTVNETLSLTVIDFDPLAGADQLACTGTSVAFSGSATNVTGCPDPEYRWLAADGSVLVDWATTSDVTLDAVTPAQAGTLRLEARCASVPDRSWSDTVELTVAELSFVPVSDQTIAENTPVTIGADVSDAIGCDSTGFRFRTAAGVVTRDWDSLPKWTIPSASLSDGGEYLTDMRCEALPDCIVTESISVAVASGLPDAGLDQAGCAGGDVLLSGVGSSAISCPDPEYRWLAPGGAVLSDWGSSSDHLLVGASATSSGTHVLEMRCASAPGTTWSDTVEVDIVELVADAGPDLAGCRDGMVPLQPTAGSAVNCASVEYRWLDATTLTELSPASADPSFDHDLLACESGMRELLLEMRCTSRPDSCPVTDRVQVACLDLPAPAAHATPGCSDATPSRLSCGSAEVGTTWTWDLAPTLDGDGNGDPTDDADQSGCELELQRNPGEWPAVLNGRTSGGCTTQVALTLVVPKDNVPDPSGLLSMTMAESHVTLAWQASATAGSHRVLRGVIGDWYAHEPMLNDDGTGCQVVGPALFEIGTDAAPGGAAGYYYLIQAVSPCDDTLSGIGRSFDGHEWTERPGTDLLCPDEIIGPLATTPGFIRRPGTGASGFTTAGDGNDSQRHLLTRDRHPSGRSFSR
ncbi:MAG: hypothetical protein AAF533_05695 [Acidobacteriota bacterium]